MYHEGKKRVHLGLWLRYVAIWILVAGVGGYLLWRDRENVEREHRMFAQVAVPGNERAYLVWANGERVEINEMMRDTVLTGMCVGGRTCFILWNIWQVYGFIFNYDGF